MDAQKPRRTVAREGVRSVVIGESHQSSDACASMVIGNDIKAVRCLSVLIKSGLEKETRFL